MKLSAQQRRTTAGPLMAACVMLALGGGCHDDADPAAEPPLTVGSKKFTENVILGEVVRQLARSTGAAAVHKRELGGTAILFKSLVNGELDAYVEYTGTLLGEILAAENLQSIGALRAHLDGRGIHMSAPLGFNNTYAVGMLQPRAAELGITRISDFFQHPTLTIGLTNEFMDRADGWPGLRDAYGLPQQPRGLDHDLAYRALAAGSIDAMDLYTTDAEIAYYDLAVLEDDLAYFPEYYAVLLSRKDVADRAPTVAGAWRTLEGAIDDAAMITMNRTVKIDREPDSMVAARFLESTLGIAVDTTVTSTAEGIWQRTAQHFGLVWRALLPAILVAVPLGIWAARAPRLAPLILGGVGIIQTIPALALFVVLLTVLSSLRPYIPIRDMWETPAIIALFLYSLLPITRNTYTGFQNIAPGLRESAAALGLTPGARLRRIELPLASPTILAGIKTAAVITVGFATLGALIGAGGYGQPILTGIRLDDHRLILSGAIPAAVMALVIQWSFDLLERVIVPQGLRL